MTEVLAGTLPSPAEIVATDLSQAMVDHAATKPALALPFDTARFDAVVCQFGAMFFPDRIAGYREARCGLRQRPDRGADAGARDRRAQCARLEHEGMSFLRKLRFLSCAARWICSISSLFNLRTKKESTE